MPVSAGLPNRSTDIGFPEVQEDRKGCRKTRPYDTSTASPVAALPPARDLSHRVVGVKSQYHKPSHHRYGDASAPPTFS